MGEIADIVSAVATVIAAVVAVVAAVDARRSAAEQGQETARQHEETKKQAVIALEALLTEQSHALQAWADEVIDRMSEAHALCGLDPQRMPEGAFFHKRVELAWRLSALVDRGRLFLPNTHASDRGLHKPAAFRGFRQQALDHVVDACRLLDHLTAGATAASPSEVARALIAARRAFVSEIQTIIDPRTRQDRLRALAGHQGGEAPERRPGEAGRP
ncbi:hypothetical protein [Azospirillum sp. ST 5-10]|uniref:hypothetical protein n=1 Tax=unclassified Azospirillum TaxID=2630922 RepID=UPI003F49F292